TLPATAGVTVVTEKPRDGSESARKWSIPRLFGQMLQSPYRPLGAAAGFAQQHAEAAALRLGVRQVDAPALALADPLHQRQAQAEALAAGRAAAHEGLEHGLALGLGNAHAAVLDQEALLAQAQQDVPLLGVVQGVRRQVAEHRAHQRAVVPAAPPPLRLVVQG